VPCEAIFNRHPQVYRSALVGVPENRNWKLEIGNSGNNQSPTSHGPQTTGHRPVIIIEPKPGCFPKNRAERERFTRELLELGRANPLTAGITDVLFHRAFPVDIRHNAKIRREDLAAWAEKQRR
jgi:acyl-CoA synthetase (AMP-forming)/AMP-acid ligase II